MFRFEYVKRVFSSMEHLNKSKLIILLFATLILFVRVNKAIAIENYSLACNKDLLKLSKVIAVSQLGVVEATNRNDGEVEKYLKSVNLGKGNPYCAAGIYWTFLEASKKINLEQKYIPLPKTGLVFNIKKYAVQNGVKCNDSPDDNTLIIWLKSKSKRGHIERIINVHKAGWVETIAFNTNSDERSSKKEGVYIKKRNLLHPLGRMRIWGIIILKAY